MFDGQTIKTIALEEALRLMPSAVMIVESPSGESILDNRQTQYMSERYLGRSVLSGVGELRDLYEGGVFELVRPDGRAYEFEEWPIMRSIRSGGEVRNEELIQRMADGTQLWLRCNSSPVYDDEGRIVAGVLVAHDITECKRAEEAIGESNRRTENILERITEGFFAVDREWRFTYINERALHRFQGDRGEELTREELLGKNVWEMFPDLVDTPFHREPHRALREQRVVEFEGFSPLDDTWYEGHVYPSEEGLSFYALDITERKRAEEERKESEKRFRATFEQAAVGIAHTALDGRWLRVNQRLCDILDYTHEELLEKTFQDITHPDDLEADLEQARRLLVGEISNYSMNKRYIKKDGSTVWGNLTGSLVRDPSGDPSYFIAVVEDIDEGKRAHKEIERRTHQQAVVAELGLRALSDGDLKTVLDEAAVLVAQTLGVEYVKIVEPLPGGKEMLLRAGVGWQEGLVGRATESAGLDSEAGYTLLSEEAVISEDVHTETRFEPSELILKHGIISGMTVVIHGQKEPFGVLCVHATSSRTFTEDDVNFLQAVANVLATAVEHQEAQEKLEEVRETERSRIARDLHDDALQDLTGALVEAQLLGQSISSEDPEALRRAERLLVALDRIGPRLRGAIYDLRLEAEQDRPFSELLESLVNLQRAIDPEHEIPLEMRGEILSGSLGQRGREVLRIVREALINARRHSGAQNVRVGVWTSDDQKKLFAEVEDDGRGFYVAQEEPSSSTTTRGGMGIKGMGERARALGGELKIESDPNKGTKVHLELALEKDHEASEEEQEEEEEVRVLLIDDHATLREALASTFEGEEGFEVVGEAGSLEEARRMLEEASDRVDVAVVDLGLPDGYGGDLISELRETNPQAQALVLSASLERSEIARAVEAGAAGVLHKTAHLDEVVEAVRCLRAGQTLMPLEEVVGMLRFAGRERQQEYQARQAIASLTTREKEVLQALAEGLNSEGIAEQLTISVRTERNHMASILSKLGVHSQLQALVFAVRHGVVEIT